MREYAVPGRPVIITGLLREVVPEAWSFAHLRQRIGHRGVELKRHVEVRVAHVPCPPPPSPVHAHTTRSYARLTHRAAPLCAATQASVSWAKLEPFDAQVTFAEFVDAVVPQGSSGGTDGTDDKPVPAPQHPRAEELRRCYLHDWGLPLRCPDLVEELRVPTYFAGACSWAWLGRRARCLVVVLTRRGCGVTSR